MIRLKDGEWKRLWWSNSLIYILYLSIIQSSLLAVESAVSVIHVVCARLRLDFLLLFFMLFFVIFFIYILVLRLGRLRLFGLVLSTLDMHRNITPKERIVRSIASITYRCRYSSVSFRTTGTLIAFTSSCA